MALGLKYVIGNGSQGQLYSPPDPQVPLLCVCLHQRYSRLYKIEGQISQAILGPLVTGSGAKAKKWIHSYRSASLPFLLSGLLHCASETASWHCSWGRNQNFDVPCPYTPLNSDMGLWTLQRWESSGQECMVKKGKESLAGSGRCRPKAISLNQSLLCICCSIVWILKITTDLMTAFGRRIRGGKRNTLKL